MNSIADLLNQENELSQNRVLPGAGGFVQGIVTDNSDKSFAGMVKVEFTAWKSGRNICQWIPLLRPYAGKEYGCYLMPEVGDIVLVGFMGPEMERPLVLGCLFPAEAGMQRKSFRDHNTLRRVKTKGGIDLTLSDEKGKESIRAVTPAGLSCAVDDEAQAITLSDKGGNNRLVVDCKNKAVTVEAEANITLKTGKCQITLDGKSGALSIKCDRLDIKATQKTAVSGGQMTELTGGVVKVEGKQLTQIKGGVVKLN